MSQKQSIGRAEFVALMALLSGTVAFSTDAMLPALPEIARELSPLEPNRAQLIVTSFVLGLGFGTLFAGIFADRFGRRPVLFGGAALYCLGSLLSYVAPTLELVLAARVIQGIGAAGPRIMSITFVRDLYSGREMARILSFVMMIFTVIPAMAPLIGALVTHLSGWRTIFLVFMAFAFIGVFWTGLRQPETLPVARRRGLTWAEFKNAIYEIFHTRTSVIAMLAQSLSMGMLFAALSTTQPIFDVVYDEGHRFHFWFAAIALISSMAAMFNARFVVQVGMRGMLKGLYSAQFCMSLLIIIVLGADLPIAIEFPLFLIWTILIFFQGGLALGNLNALALEPLGHIAGTAASIMTATATVLAVAIAVPVGLAFNGTPLPLVFAVLGCSGFAFVLTTQIRREGD